MDLNAYRHRVSQAEHGNYQGHYTRHGHRWVTADQQREQVGSVGGLLVAMIGVGALIAAGRHLSSRRSRAERDVASPALPEARVIRR